MIKIGKDKVVSLEAMPGDIYQDAVDAATWLSEPRQAVCFSGDDCRPDRAATRFLTWLETQQIVIPPLSGTAVRACLELARDS